LITQREKNHIDRRRPELAGDGESRPLPNCEACKMHEARVQVEGRDTPFEGVYLCDPCRIFYKILDSSVRRRLKK